jgi:dolichyl-phosphate-mannose-protein mannosyltransferase
MKLWLWRPELIILTVAAALTRFWDLFTPHAVVFDEVYFKAYAGAYLKGAYYFDIHPPLGKLLLAGWAWLLHLNAAGMIGDDPSVLLRLLPALAGTLIIPVFYLFLRQLKASRRVATLGATLLLLDNALLVESRFILVDSLLILFGLAAVTCFLAARHHKGRLRLWLLAASGLLAGLAASTKWTGLTALGLIGLVWLADLAINRSADWWKRLLSEGLILVGVPALVYMGTFWLHFALLPKTGPGDAFMSQTFQQTLVGNPNYNPNTHLTYWRKLSDLNVEMVAADASLKNATHPYASKWYTWPVMQRPIYYWAGEVSANGSQGNIYLLGNPVLWWGILLSVVAIALANAEARRRLKPYRIALLILATGYVMNFLPFSQIVRVMFLYHYFFALIYSLALVVIAGGALLGWMDDRTPFWQFPNNWSRNLFVGLMVAALVGWLYFAPLSYGWPLSPSDLARHIWLPTWR